MKDARSSPATSSRPWRWIRLGLGLLISVIFFWLAFQHIPVDQVLSRVGEVRLELLLLAMGMKVGVILLMAMRAAVISGVRTQHTFFDHLGLVLVAQAGNAALPLRLGELLRVRMSKRVLDQPAGGAVACIFLERLIDLIFIAGIASAGAVMGARDLAGTKGVVLILGAGVLLLLVLRLGARHRSVRPLKSEEGVKRRGSRLREQVRAAVVATEVVARPRGMLILLLLGVAQWSFSLLSVVLWIVAFGEVPSALRVTSFIAMVSLAMVLPSAPSGVGTYEFFGARALMMTGVGEASAFAITLTGHLLVTLPVIILGLPFILYAVLGGWPLRSSREAQS